MNDATGMPQTALLLGGTSDIGIELLRQLAARRLEVALLAGRDAAALERAADGLRKAGVAWVGTLAWDAADPDGSSGLAERAREALGGRDLDLVVMAAGDLGTADLDELDGGKVFGMMAANVAGPAAALTELGKALARQGAGRIVVLSSVAGLRVRLANFVYGAGKAGLDGFALGLAEALRGSGVQVCVVRPGFVHTRMTEGRPAAPMSVQAPDVAAAVLRGLERSSAVVYVPAQLQAVFAGFRLLPAAVWRRLPG